MTLMGQNNVYDGLKKNKFILFSPEMMLIME